MFDVSKADGYIAWQLFEDEKHHAAGTVIRECYLFPALSLKLRFALLRAFYGDGVTILMQEDEWKNLFIFFRAPSALHRFRFLRLVVKLRRVLRNNGLMFRPLSCPISITH